MNIILLYFELYNDSYRFDLFQKSLILRLRNLPKLTMLTFDEPSHCYLCNKKGNKKFPLKMDKKDRGMWYCYICQHDTTAGLIYAVKQKMKRQNLASGGFVPSSDYKLRLMGVQKNIWKKKCFEMRKAWYASGRREPGSLPAGAPDTKSVSKKDKKHPRRLKRELPVDEDMASLPQLDLGANQPRCLKRKRIKIEKEPEFLPVIMNDRESLRLMKKDTPVERGTGRFSSWTLAGNLPGA